jgi:TonB family protein
LSAGAARFGAPLAASLALHLVVLGAATGGDSEPVAVRIPATLLVQLQTLQTPAPTPPPTRTDPPAAARALPKRYLTSSELDERAVPLEMAPLLYPKNAYINRIRGTVRVRVYISAGGHVDKAEVVQAVPKGHFEEAAIDAVQRTTFTAARKAGRAVPSQKLVEVEFDPYGPTPEERL